MTMITGNQTRGDSRAERTFDSRVAPEETAVRPAPASALARESSAPRTIEDLMLAEPSRPRASLKAVALIFLAIALVQLGVLALSFVSFDLSAFRLILAYVVVAPAVLYTIVAAWDHRQLVASGQASAPRWEWALVFPPIYLGLRWWRATDSPRDMGAALGWGIAQFVVTAAFLVFATTALVTAPVQPAGAVLSPEIIDVTASVVEQQVEQGWADAGEPGRATCVEPVSQAPGTALSCIGVFSGSPIEFTAVLGDQASGEAPVIISRWSRGAAG